MDKETAKALEAVENAFGNPVTEEQVMRGKTEDEPKVLSGKRPVHESELPGCLQDMEGITFG